MRLARLTMVLLVGLAGCQGLGRPWGASAPPQRLPAPAESQAAQPTIQQAQHAEPVLPTPQPQPTEPEPLPPAALQPVELGVLTLADLEHMALAANPSVGRAAALVEAARGNWVQVGLHPNPVVGYEGQQIGSGGVAEQDGVFAQQEFVRGHKLGLSRQVAAQEIAKAKQALAAQQQRVLTDVRIAYYQVLIAERQQRVAGELRDLAGQAFDVAEALLKGQQVGKGDVLQAQLERDTAEILAQNAANRHTAAWRALATVIGDPHLPPQRLAGNLDEPRPELDWQSSRERLLSSSPGIAAAIAEIERARWAVARARAEAVPNVTVQGLYNWRDNGAGGQADGAITVGLPLPLWDRNQGGIMQAQGQVAAAERALQQLELSLENRLAPVYERYANALHQVRTYRERILPAAQESLDISRRLYQAGEQGYLNVLTAQRTWSQTNVNYLESLRDLRQAEAEIDGLLLTGSLDSR